MPSQKRECHKCPVRADFEREQEALCAKFRPICVKCPGAAEKSYKGISFVRLGNGDDIDGRILAHAEQNTQNTEQTEPVSEGVTSLPIEVEDKLRQLLAIYTQISLSDHAVIIGLLKGKTLKAIADELHVTKIMTWKRFHRLCRQYPFVKALAHGTIGTASGKVKINGPRKPQQGELPL